MFGVTHEKTTRRSLAPHARLPSWVGGFRTHDSPPFLSLDRRCVRFAGAAKAPRVEYFGVALRVAVAAAVKSF